MISDEHVVSSFKAAKKATKLKKDSQTCKKHWKTFKDTATSCLVDVFNAWLPAYVPLGPEDPVSDIINLNKNLMLSEEQKKFFIAYNIVFYTISQNKLLIRQMYQEP